MGTYRIYPKKSNTLIEGTNINTGENSVTELWYGNEGISRYLLQFDFDSYNSAYALGYVPHITASTATFNMTNCHPIFEKYPYSSAESASSSEVEVKVIQQYWDSGIGYDFYGIDTIDGNSNWYSATTTQNWALPGGDFVYTVFSGTIDNGNEDLTLDITNEVELWNSFMGDNYGLIVKFSDSIESLSGNTKHILKYYTENARTKYNIPYIELKWDSDQVKDQRDEIGNGLTKRLYFYLKNHGVFASAEDISGVTITYENPSYTDETFSQSAITQQYPGVYYIEYTGPSYKNGQQTFIDTWSVKLNPTNGYTEIPLTGNLESAITSWDYNQTDVLEAKTYKITMPNLNDYYHRGEIIYMDVSCFEQYTTNVVVVKNLEYRISLVDGKEENHRSIIDWTPCSYTRDINGFPLNTDWFYVGYTYNIHFRYGINGAVTEISEDTFKFSILEEIN